MNLIITLVDRIRYHVPASERDGIRRAEDRAITGRYPDPEYLDRVTVWDDRAYTR